MYFGNEMSVKFSLFPGLGLHRLDNFHRGHCPDLQVVSTTENAGIPSAAVRGPTCHTTTGGGDYASKHGRRRKAASLPTGYTSETAAISISGTAACSDWSAPTGLYSAATIRPDPEISYATLSCL